MYCGEDGSILKGQWADDRFLGERITPTGSCAYLFDVSTFTADDDDELVYGRDVEERCNTALNMIVQRHNRKYFGILILLLRCAVILDFLRNAYAYYFSPLKSGENPVKIGFNKFNVWTIINDYGIKKLGLTIGKQVPS
jgi:hypothetical protein